MKTSISFILAWLTLIIQPVKAQVANESELFQSIKKMDSLLFDQGFNQCDLQLLKKITHDDLNFYHDIGGQQNKTQFLQATKQNICANKNQKITRQLVEETMQVYQLKNNNVLYGAIQKGVHEFFIEEPGTEKHITGKALFTHVWTLEGDQWQLVESLSYEHEAADVSMSQAQTENKHGTKFDANFHTPLFDRDAKIKELLAQHQIPSLAIGYIESGKLQQIKVFQNDQIPVKQPYSHQSIYKVASLTKPIVALTTLKLVDHNKWDLDRPIKTYFADPNLTAQPELNTLTTRHILSHQSGLPNWRYLQANNQLKFQFKPGTQYQYSGEGFEYLRKALEKTFNKDLNALALQWVFEPLEMNNTSFYWTDDLAADQYAVEHDEHGKPIAFKKHTAPNAAANLLTTIEDYGLFMTHILSGAGLDEALYQDMLMNQLSASEDKKFGLGWEIIELIDGEYALQHTGGDYGIKTIAFVLPNSNRGLVMFTNSENGITIWSKIVSEIFGDLGQALIDANLKNNF